ncbi:MAG: hypothetical protein ACRCUM_00440 [Mycoplasmoidaceae bacterium]
MPSYDKLKDFLKNGNLKKENILESKVYKYIEIFFDKSSIYFSNIQSMCNERTPNQIRIRNDNFLQDAVIKNKKSLLIVGFNYEGIEKIIIFSNMVYFNYNQSTKSSNSIITFTSDQFFSFFKNNNNGTMIKSSILNKKKINVAFYLSDLNEIDEIGLQEFIINHSDKSFYNIESSYEFYTPSIPKKNKEKVFSNFQNNNFECSVRFINKEFCRCKLTKPFEKGDNQLHHLIPKSYFKKLYKSNDSLILNWDEIHKPINLIPICYYCHKDIHSDKISSNKVEKKFDQILKVYKEYGIYESFIKYMFQNTNMKSIEELKAFYLEDS